MGLLVSFELRRRGTMSVTWRSASMIVYRRQLRRSSATVLRDEMAVLVESVLGGSLLSKVEEIMRSTSHMFPAALSSRRLSFFRL